MQDLLSLLGYSAGTVLVYLGIRRLSLRFNHPLLNVVALSAGVIIGLLVACDIPYAAYVPAKDAMTMLLGPATVALAVPLYRHRRLLYVYGPAILTSVAAGSLLAMLSAGYAAKVGGLPQAVVVSILPKGVSIPFAVEIARIYNGIPALSAAFVVATGTLGSLLGGWLLTRVGITHPVARGLALGTTSHAQGTATALLEGEQQGAMAGLAMILAGMLTAAFAPLGVWLLGVV